MKLREFLSPVAKNLNSIKHFVNLHAYSGPLIVKGSSDILSNLALHHNSQFRCRQPRTIGFYYRLEVLQIGCVQLYKMTARPSENWRWPVAIPILEL